MRQAFVAKLVELAGRDPRVLLLTADLGFMVVEPFSQAYPDRFFNIGVAEQNMIGIATGLADSGFIPFCYSIAPFATLRPYEFIRNGPVMHRLPVRIIGVGGGFDYGQAGPSHHGLEDISVMRSLPGMTVVAPIDDAQVTHALECVWDLPGPVYMRLSKEGPMTPGIVSRFALGRADVLRSGDDILLVVTGSLVSETFAAADQLAQQGIAASVMAVPCIAPPPIADLRAELAKARAVLTVESHQAVGGLGSLVAEVLAEMGVARPFRRLSADILDDTSGSAAWHMMRQGLTSKGIAAAAKALTSRNSICSR